MKRKNIFTVMAGVMLFSSCQVAKNTTSSSNFEGEWNITELNGSAIKGDANPYIGFDISKNHIYGNSGCNNITGSFNFKGKKGKIELGQMATTLMACPNMELEQNVLSALNKVERINTTDNEHLVLCDKNKKPIMQLEKRFRVVPLSDISNEWRIISVFGENLPSMEQVPFVNFNIENNRVSAYAGCNRLSATFKSGEKANGITISKVISTRMACPDMTTEQNVITALEQTRSYGVSMKGNLLLFSASGKIVMELMRNK